MKNLEAIVFDMDGTLYQFPDGATFGESPLGKTVKQNITSFLAQEFSLPDETACLQYDELKQRYDGEISLGLEREFGIDRMRFFDETWDINPQNIIIPADDIKSQLEQLDVQCALLTAAPRTWATRTLGYMGVAEVFGENVFTGEPDIRKPNPEVFRRIIAKLGVDARQAVSIGDQEYSDITPARQIGMRTVRIDEFAETEADVQARNINEALQKLREQGMLA